MKNKIILTLIVVSIVTVFAGCKKKAGPLACASSTVQYSEDITEFVNNQSKANCERVVKSIKDIYSSCTTLTGLDRKAYEEAEADLNCNDYN
ncbi:hypothetical protein SAMN06298216_2347 [Spirosomataceae bacterium TFI 002]|nr:hypothetical protein SAMN06298216_2347 [Spirosomataceae bacterium TFI 002]